MSITSLRGAAGFASTAFDTARSTWKAMAEAAVAMEEPPATPGQPEEQPAAPAAQKGVRRGTILDAYA